MGETPLPIAEMTFPTSNRKGPRRRGCGGRKRGQGKGVPGLAATAEKDGALLAGVGYVDTAHVAVFENAGPDNFTVSTIGRGDKGEALVFDGASEVRGTDEARVIKLDGAVDAAPLLVHGDDDGGVDIDGAVVANTCPHGGVGVGCSGAGGVGIRRVRVGGIRRGGV